MPPADIGAHPVVIIGAGRSGTNMLRDVLVRLEGVETWPCDEINYIWRHGHRKRDTDELEPADATGAVCDFVRGRFGSMARNADFGNAASDARVLLEKTCANSLRVGFVDTILPEARYLYLLRDGRDVVASASRRWKASLDVRYLAAKARYVPPSDLPYYASRYLGNRIAKLRDPEARLAVWGPRFEGWRKVAAESDLQTICAVQWARCIDRSDAAFEAIPDQRCMVLHYESLVSDPIAQIESVLRFLNLTHSRAAIENACRDINDASVGRGRDQGINSGPMASALARHGYA